MPHASTKQVSDENPKLDPDPPSINEKPPKDYVSGEDSMTGAQASYLKTPLRGTRRPKPFDPALTKPKPPAASMG